MEKILITNDIDLAKYAQECGIERIMVDLEVIGKEERQGHLNTVFSKHTFTDIQNIRKVLNKSKLLVRINPIHEHSKNEIEKVIDLGADIIMLPMFKTKTEVEEFINLVNNRTITNLLLETSQALVRIDDILEIKGIDEIHIGLNDLHLSMGLNFMFELLSGGVVEYLSKKIIEKNIKFGFGGIARIGYGKLDSSLILSEHYRLGSDMVILSRDFKNYQENYNDIQNSVNLKEEVKKVELCWKMLEKYSLETIIHNKFVVKEHVNKIAGLK